MPAYIRAAEREHGELRTEKEPRETFALGREPGSRRPCVVRKTPRTQYMILLAYQPAWLLVFIRVTQFSP